MIQYRTIEKEATVEQVIDRSRFIGHIRPVETRGAAEAFFAEIRAAHRGATHNVPAFVIGDQFQLQWASDDGEPQGTSGAPVVQMLVREGITNTALVITRYFGGVKLGTGGLVRAYTGTARLALEAAGRCRVEDRSILTVELDYTWLGKLQNLASEDLFQILDTAYTDKVTVTLSAVPEQKEELVSLLENLTAGAARILTQRTEPVKVPDG